MPDERRQFRLLYRDYLFRILDLELLGSRGEVQRLLTQFAALLGAFSFTFTVYFVPRYGLSTLPWEKLSRLGWVDQDLLIATTMAIAAMFTILAWNNVLPDRRDLLVLGLLPVRTRTVFLAKVAALGTALGVAVVALNAFTGLAYPFAVSAPDGGMTGVVRALGAYWITMLSAGLLVCCALLAVQAIAALVLPYRLFLRLSSVLQLAAFFAVLGVYFLKPAYSAAHTWVPSFWFLGLFQTLNGSHEFGALSARAVRAIYGVCPFAIVLFSLAFARYQRSIVEQPEIAPSDRSHPAMRIVRFLAGKLIPRPIARAILLFTARTIARSRHHRLLLAAYGGIGLAVALAFARDLLYGSRSYERMWRNPRWNEPNAPLLVGSFVVLFFAILGSRAVFSQPITLSANWTFRITAVNRPADYFAAVRRSQLALVALPILAGCAMLFFAIWPPIPALKHILVLTAAGFLMVQLSLARFRKIPFACSYLPGKANLHVKLGLYAIGFLFLTSQAIELEFHALQNLTAYIVVLAILLALGFWAYRRNVTVPAGEILFDEVPAADIEALDLHDGGPRGGKPFEPRPEIPRTPFSLEQLFRDVREAARILTRSPAISAAVITLIAVGIGGNATIYSMVHAVMSKPAPGVNADGLVVFGAARDGRLLDPGWHSYPEYIQFAANTRTMQSVAAVLFERFNLTLHDGSTYRLRGNLVTRNYFQTVGASLLKGREFTADEARGAAPLAAIITYAVWQNQFHLANDILGQPVLLNGLPATIVGVTRPGFHGTSLVPNLEICVPVVSYSRVHGTESRLTDGTVQGVGLLGRLAPGVSLAAAQAEFDSLSRAFETDPERPKRVVLAPYTATAFGPNSGPQARRFMAILMAVAMLTLLIVCANVANLMLARSVARRREIAIRFSMGAPRLRIVRMLLAEGLVLSFAATAAAWLMAFWLTRAVVVLFPPLESGGRMDADLTPDGSVAVYAMLLALVSALAFTVTPALRIWRQELFPSLKRGEHGIVAGRSKMAGILIVAQIAFCAVLLIGGGLAWRSLSLIDTSDLGFSRDHLVLAAVNTAGATDDPRQTLALLERVRDRLQQVPGVESVSWAIAAPPHSHPWMGLAAQVAASSATVPTDGTLAGPDYMRTLGVPVLAGRGLERSDMGAASAAAVINRKLAEALWPGQPAVGRTFLLAGRPAPLEVVGVVADGAFNGVGEDGSFSGLAKSERRPFIFLADGQPGTNLPERTFHVRYHGSLAALAPAVRAAIHETDSRLTVFSVRTMEAEWREFTSPIRLLVTLVGCSSLGALLVAAVGLYAIVAFYTRKRTRELGIRIALGASPGQTARLIVREGLVLTAAGLAIGLAICAIAGKTFAHLLFGVTPTDGITWLTVIGLLTAVSLAASGLPARRAARVDPMLALREE